MARSYNQDCILAYALDILGERWTLLIARELFLGPRRFADLLNALPGIGTNLLSKRLKDLETLSIVESDETGSNRHQYRLTNEGENLRPSVRSLMLWSIEYYLSRSTPSAVVDLIHSNNLNPDSIALAVELYAPSVTPYGQDYVAHLTVDEDQYTLYNMNNELIARRGQDAPASAHVKVEVEKAMMALRGMISADTLKAELDFTGREEVIHHIIDCFTLEGERYRKKNQKKQSA